MKKYFTTKEVVSPSLGEKLKKARESSGLSLRQISEISKIQVKYLERLEKGDYEALPADVYIKGFLKILAPLLGLDTQETINCYKKEQIIRERLQKKNLKKIKPISHTRPTFIITPKIIFALLVSIAFIGIGGWLAWQISSFASSPYLVINNPSGDLTVKSSDFVLKGITEKEVKLTINGEIVMPDKDGYFEEQINLGPGLNTIKAVATNRFGKTTTVTRRIILEE